MSPLLECWFREPGQYVVNEMTSAVPDILIILLLKSYQAVSMYIYSLLG